ncbi:MAG: response regulator transcription factor [Clostridia bacterium]|nr:response regulator transcription factor [Clostridia bacterium]
MNIAIVDDDKNQRDHLTYKVKLWARDRGQTCAVTEFSSAEAFTFEFAENNDIDILLLDIEMPGMNGVELARKLRADGEELQIIFITGYYDFISDGYDVSALHYLMKPVADSKLFEVLDRALDRCERSVKRIKVSFDRETKLIPVSDIMYLEA